MLKILMSAIILLVITNLSLAAEEKCQSKGKTAYGQEVITCKEIEKTHNFLRNYSSTDTLGGKIEFLANSYEEKILPNGKKVISAKSQFEDRYQTTCEFEVVGDFGSKLSNQRLTFTNLKLEKREQSIYWTFYGLQILTGIDNNGNELTAACRKKVAVASEATFPTVLEVLNVFSEQMRLSN